MKIKRIFGRRAEIAEESTANAVFAAQGLSRLCESITVTSDTAQDLLSKALTHIEEQQAEIGRLHEALKKRVVDSVPGGSSSVN